jgi:hypothetical protein
MEQKIGEEGLNSMDQSSLGIGATIVRNLNRAEKVNPQDAHEVPFFTRTSPLRYQRIRCKWLQQRLRLPPGMTAKVRQVLMLRSIRRRRISDKSVCTS